MFVSASAMKNVTSFTLLDTTSNYRSHIFICRPIDNAKRYVIWDRRFRTNVNGLRK